MPTGHLDAAPVLYTLGFPFCRLNRNTCALMNGVRCWTWCWWLEQTVVLKGDVQGQVTVLLPILNFDLRAALHFIALWHSVPSAYEMQHFMHV